MKFSINWQVLDANPVLALLLFLFILAILFVGIVVIIVFIEMFVLAIIHAFSGLGLINGSEVLTYLNLTS